MSENDRLAPILANACESCGDCFHPLIGPNTDWCQDCGCPSADHTRMDRVIPPRRGRT